MSCIIKLCLKFYGAVTPSELIFSTEMFVNNAYMPVSMKGKFQNFTLDTWVSEMFC